jgi:hypothetical protein
MKRFLRLVVLIPVAIVLVLLAVANRHVVTVSIDPFGDPDPALSLQIPLFWLLFAMLALGIVAGGMATWIGQGRWRKAARQDHAEAERLRREMARTLPAGPGLPAPGDSRDAA